MTEGFTVTDGSVEYKHSKPRAEYETVAPLVRLNFTIAEGSDPDAVVSKVMGMAMRHVEGVLMGEDRALGAETPPAHRGRPPSRPIAATDTPIEEAEKIIANMAEPEIKLDLKKDVQPLAQKVSAHLAKVDGNINKLRAVIKDCGGNSLLTIPEARWPEFIIEAKKLLP